MPRFVILRHEDQHGVHFDFMLECQEVLKTWALPEPPKSGSDVECQSLADHRLAYLDYEGPISEERGSVTQWDSGSYIAQKQAADAWVVKLEGKKIAGRATLRRSTGGPNQWCFSM